MTIVWRSSRMRGSDKPKSRMTLLDEKNKALDEEIRRLRAERQRLERIPQARLRNQLSQTTTSAFLMIETVIKLDTAVFLFCLAARVPASDSPDNSGQALRNP
jgi:hypothetical protein